MILRDANNMLQSVVNSSEEFEIQYISEGKIPSDLRTILTDKTYSDLQQIIRDNVYAKVVPYTTRPPKEGEVDNEHYKFVSVETFVELQRNEMLLEQGCFQGKNLHILKHFFLFDTSSPFLFILSTWL